MGMDDISVLAMSLDMSLCTTTSDNQKNPPQKIGLVKAVFLISRSIVGVGVLTQPHLNSEFGVLSIGIVYPIVACYLIYTLSLLSNVADHMKYKGASLEEFTERTLGKTHRTLATIFNLIFNISCSIVGVIFSVSFVNYALCQLGNSQCNNLVMINLIG